MNRNSILKKSLVILLITLFIMIGTGTALAFVSPEDYPVPATFEYTIWVQPHYTIGLPYDNYGIIHFNYGSNYTIVEPQYSELFNKRLKVLPYREYQHGFNLDVFWYATEHGGLFLQASTYGIDLPYPFYLSPYEDGDSIAVNVTDLIAQNNIFNDTIDMQWSLSSASGILASVSDYPRDRVPLNYALVDLYQRAMDCKIEVTVRNGLPIQISSGNLTTDGTVIDNQFDFETLNWTYRRSLNVPSPSILQAKQNVPYLLATSLILVIVVVPVTYYYAKQR